MPRAKRGFGTIRRRDNGKYQAYYLGPDGNFHRPPKPFTTKMDAEAWLMKERALLEADTWTPAKSRRAATIRAVTAFGPFAEEWIATRELKPRTRALYRSLLDRFLIPEFGTMALREITPTAVRVWHSTLELDHPTQRAHAYSLLRTILSTAVDDELIPVNPCRVHGAGATTRARDIRPATIPELETIAKTMPERYRALVMLSAWCGLRWGEAIELRRKDVDAERGVLSIRRGVTRVGGESVVGTPKTTSSIRNVAVPPHLLPMVRQHLAKHTAPGPEALLFPSATDPSKHLSGGTFRKHWEKARHAAGRDDLRFHDARHTGAVLAAATGATLAELMARLGHSTSAAALRYQHVVEGRDEEIARRLSEIAQGER